MSRTGNRTDRVVRRAATMACGLALCAFVPAAFAIPPEVWVVGERAREIAILDDLADVPATIETISLGGVTDPAPYGIAFSTLSHHPGEFAFVTQGPDIRVIEHVSRNIVATCAVAPWLGVQEVVLRGVDAARPDIFVDPVGMPVEQSYLHVAADVRPGAGDPLVPWFIVMDQATLTDLVAPCGNAVVGHGPLEEPSAVPTEAMEVRVLGAPAGQRVQRAWYTYREQSTPARLSTVLVNGGPVVGQWSRGRTVTLPNPMGEPVPDSVHPGAPHSRELPLLPDGPAGDLVDLQTGQRCSLGGLPRAVSVTGPGLGSYSIWTARLDPGGPGPDLLQLSNWETCDADPPLAIGRDPVDIDTLGRVEWREVYVANRASDSVSVVRQVDPATVIHIRLAPPAVSCQKCPRSLAVRERPETVCRAIRLEKDFVDGKTAIRHRWDGVGCQLIESYKHWCRCLEINPDLCPSACVENCPVQPMRTGEIWCEVDIVTGGGGGGESTYSNDGDGDTETNIEPNDSGGE